MDKCAFGLARYCASSARDKDGYSVSWASRVHLTAIKPQLTDSPLYRYTSQARGQGKLHPWLGDPDGPDDQHIEFMFEGTIVTVFYRRQTPYESELVVFAPEDIYLSNATFKVAPAGAKNRSRTL